jgi:chromate reductase, NAD(P)H dehydrogenase (quinone)
MCGSLQAASANRAALDVAVAHLRSCGGVDVEEFDQLGDVPPFDPSVQEPSAAVARLREMLGASHVVMIATPEYAGGLAGALKNALDWIVGSGELYDKPAVVLSAGTTGGAHARHQLIRTLTWQGALVVADLGIASPRTKTDRSGAFTDAVTIDAIQKLAAVARSAPSLPDDQRNDLVSAVLASAGVEQRER